MYYDRIIKVKKINPPLGEYNFAAVLDIYKVENNKSEAIYTLPEIYGETDFDARNNAEQKYKDWLEKNKQHLIEPSASA